MGNTISCESFEIPADPTEILTVLGEQLGIKEAPPSQVLYEAFKQPEVEEDKIVLYVTSRLTERYWRLELAGNKALRSYYSNRERDVNEPNNSYVFNMADPNAREWIYIFFGLNIENKKLQNQGVLEFVRHLNEYLSLPSEE